MTANKKIPALRFKEFEGEWNCTKIEEISKVGSGGTPNRSIATYWNGDIPWITTSLIDSNKIDYADEYITKEGLENSSAKLFPSGAVLMAMYGQGKTRGKVAILGIEATTNQACAAIIVKQEIINPKYLFQNLAGRYYEVRNLSNAGGQENLSGELIKNLKVCFPSLPEQQKIASFLTAVDDKIQQLTKKKALLEQYKKGVMQQIFNQQIRFKDDDGKDYPDWEEKELGKVSIINPKSENLPNSFIYIDLESVENGILLKEQRIILQDAPSRAQRLLERDDILFQMVRPYQKNNLYFQKEGEYVASTGYAQIRAKTNAKYLYHYLHLDSFVTEVLLRCTGTSYPAISSGDLAKIKIQFPAKEEQQKIANFLTGIVNKINAVDRQLEQTQAYKKGLLQQMFV